MLEIGNAVENTMCIKILSLKVIFAGEQTMLLMIYHYLKLLFKMFKSTKTKKAWFGARLQLPTSNILPLASANNFPQVFLLSFLKLRNKIFSFLDFLYFCLYPGNEKSYWRSTGVKTTRFI